MHFGFGLTSFSLKNILLINMKKRHRRVFIIICLSNMLFVSVRYIDIYIYVEKSPSIKVHRVTDPPLFFLYTFNFSQTVGEMVF